MYFLNVEVMKKRVSKLIQSRAQPNVLHSPGQRPGYQTFTDNAPCKGSFNVPLFFTVAITGRIVRFCIRLPRAMP